MKNASKKFDFLNEEQKQKVISNIVGYFQDSRDEQIGFLAAEEILDLFLETAGSVIYNKAVLDSKNLLKQGMEDLEINLDILLNK